MADTGKQLNKAASALATAILNAGPLRGDERTTAGRELEIELKRFAQVILQKAGEKQPPNPG